MLGKAKPTAHDVGFKVTQGNRLGEHAVLTLPLLTFYPLKLEELPHISFKVLTLESYIAHCYIRYFYPKYLFASRMKLVESKRGSMSETHEGTECGSDSVSRSFFRDFDSTNQDAICFLQKKAGLFLYKINEGFTASLRWQYQLLFVSNLQDFNTSHVMFIDSDDYIVPEALDLMLEKAHLGDIITSYSSSFIDEIDEAKPYGSEISDFKSPKTIRSDGNISRSFTTDSLEYLAKSNNYFSFAWGALMRREVLENLRFIDGITNEDFRFGIALMLGSHNLYFYKKSLVKYRVRKSGNISNEANFTPKNATMLAKTYTENALYAFSELQHATRLHGLFYHAALYNLKAALYFASYIDDPRAHGKFFTQEAGLYTRLDPSFYHDALGPLVREYGMFSKTWLRYNFPRMARTYSAIKKYICTKLGINPSSLPWL